MRVVLFDIDGTLLLTGRAGQYAISEMAGSNALPERAYAGRTDRAIITDQLKKLGIAETETAFEDFRVRFVQLLSLQLPQRKGHVLPGVRQLLDQLQRIPDVAIGLLTGNLQAAARLKLIHYELDHYFYARGEPLGAFGDRHYDRDDVARAAFETVRCQFLEEITGDDIWIVGDTPLDIQCARAISARVLAVATGGYSMAELDQAGADHVVADLSQIEHWWRDFQVEVE